MPNENNNADLRRYETDVEGVSLNNLETGLWWSRNKGKLKKTLIVFLILISIVSWGYALYGFGDYFLEGRQDDDRMMQDMIDTKVIDAQSLNIAKDLSLSAVGVLGSGPYDFYVLAKNTNDKYGGTFSYCFMAGDQKINCGNDFIMPGDKKYILSLAQTLNGQPVTDNLKFIVNSISWTKLDPHKIPDWQSYKNERLNIAIKNEKFSPAGSSGLTDKVDLNTLSFSIQNNSAYGYFTVPLTIILFSGNQVVGVNRYQVQNLNSLDQRDIEMTWVGNLGNVDSQDITPDINLFDANNYMQPGV